MKYQLFLMDTDILLLLQYYMTSNLENMVAVQIFGSFGSNQYDHDLLVSEVIIKIKNYPIKTVFVQPPCVS